MTGVFLDNVLGVCQFQFSIVKNVAKNMLQKRDLRKLSKSLEKKVPMLGMI